MTTFQIFLVSAALGLLAAGCAPALREPGTPLDANGEPSKSPTTDSGLVVRAEEAGFLETEHYGVVEFTFQNNSKEWIRIRRVKLDFGSKKDEESVFVPWGPDLEGWRAATEQRIPGPKAYAPWATLAFLQSGSALAGGQRFASREPAVRAATAGFGIVAGIAAIASMAKSTGSVPLPSGHLLAEPFSVPPGLSLTKWVVLNTPEYPGASCIVSTVLEYELESGKTERIVLPILESESPWQREACPREASATWSTP